jgi:hypothetical protein
MKLPYNKTKAEILRGWLGSSCMACAGEERLVIDHDHATGAIRGVLCHHCNIALGLLGEALERIEGLRRYLQRIKNPRRGGRHGTGSIDVKSGGFRVRVTWMGKQSTLGIFKDLDTARAALEDFQTQGPTIRRHVKNWRAWCHGKRPRKKNKSPFLGQSLVPHGALTTG